MRRALTLVELCIGLVVVSIVLGALAAFSLATAQAWQQGAVTSSSGSQSIAAIPIIGNLAAARLDKEIAGAIGVGGYYSGTLTSSSGQQASLLLWTKNDSTANTTIEPNETELIEYDATDHCIYKYTAPDTTTTPSKTYPQFSNNWIPGFKSLASKITLARNVDGMQINVTNASSATALPLVEYRLYFNRGGLCQTRYGAVCVRSPILASGQVYN